MPDETVSVPIPVRVRAIPGGSRLRLDAFAQSVIEDVLDALLSTDRDSDLYERLIALAELTPDERALLPENRMPYEELVADLTERARKFTPLYGMKGIDLAAQLMQNAVPSLPVGNPAAESWKASESAEAAVEREPLNGGAAA
ncbi:hypothetical protein GTW29_09270 [Streptomyces sp. SID7834]|nr:hypothetical protein [Streptomyces sp. SID7834]MYT56913.1 hypothetical protein [Streptomyces sp. SID7834]